MDDFGMNLMGVREWHRHPITTGIHGSGDVTSLLTWLMSVRRWRGKCIINHLTRRISHLSFHSICSSNVVQWTNIMKQFFNSSLAFVVVSLMRSTSMMPSFSRGRHSETATTTFPHRLGRTSKAADSWPPKSDWSPSCHLKHKLRLVIIIL